MRVVFVSGLSGSGKSVALHMLEDLGYYCIDNLPAALLKPFVSHAVQDSSQAYERSAVGLDARNDEADIARVPDLIDELKRSGIDCEFLFLLTSDDELLRRFAETRRAHPLTRHGESLREAIAIERRVLEPLLNIADQVIDTSRMGVHELRDLIRSRVELRTRDRLAVQFESFGFKHGLPGDADFVFDARSLPNPYWDTTLRDLTGLDAPVQKFLVEQSSVQRFIEDIERFVGPRLQEFRGSNRHYLTVAVGCTGGRHRSVYIVEKLAEHFRQHLADVKVRHSSLPPAG